MTHWFDGNIEKIADMLRAGMSSRTIGAQFGVSRGAVQGLVSRNDTLRAIGFNYYSIPRNGRQLYRERRQREQSEAAEAKRAAGLTYLRPPSYSLAEVGWREQMGLMPQDTRDLTGRIMGDPVPDPRAPWRGLRA